jgi:hypothetical protein
MRSRALPSCRTFQILFVAAVVATAAFWGFWPSAFAALRIRLRTPEQL